ncbi:MAG: hypothetical protein ACRDKE_06845 [Solirubrobacterales bacterium]
MSRSARMMLLTITALLALNTSFAGTSAASVQLGETCLVGGAGAGTMIQASLLPGSANYTVPSNGVITEWGAKFPLSGAYFGKMKVVRPTGVPNTFTVVGSSAEVSLAAGFNSFPTQIPVQAGDVIASSGTTGAVVCWSAHDEDVVSHITTEMDPPVGATLVTDPGSILATRHVGVHATLEGDADADGFGDETQDQCPSLAAFHTACPIVKLGKYVLPPTSKQVGLILVSSTPTTAKVSGEVFVKLPGSSRRSKGTRFVVGPVSKSVPADTMVEFLLKFPKKLVAALKTQAKSKKLRMKLTAVGVGVANTDTTVSTVVLRGTKK